MFHTTRGGYPQSIGELFREWISGPATDPRGRDYHYEIAPDGRPRATSLGSDGRPGGDGEAADTVRGGSP